MCPRKPTCSTAPGDVYVETSSGRWFSPSSLDNLLSVLAEVPGDGYRLVAGNTGAGVYKDDSNRVTNFIDISKV